MKDIILSPQVCEQLCLLHDLLLSCSYFEMIVANSCAFLVLITFEPLLNDIVIKENPPIVKRARLSSKILLH